jgi:glycosidase
VLLGATATWISPIPDNVDEGYHGYWQRNMSQVNANFGSSQDLQLFVNESHKREMKVMVDVVINHVGPQVRAARPGVCNYCILTTTRVDKWQQWRFQPFYPL